MHEYRSENLSKYLTKNPLKRYLISNFINEVNIIIKTIKPASVLEVGCGEGFLLKAMSSVAVDCVFTGIDINKKAIAYAQKLNPEIKLIVSSIYNFESKLKFELVVCCEVLEHLEKVDAALKKITALSSKHVILSVPLEPWFRLGNILSLSRLKTLGNTPGHINHWGITTFRELASPFFNNLEIKVVFPWILAFGKVD